MRTFIAIELPENIRKKIFQEFQKLKGLDLIRGKFVEEENLHLTMKFLDEQSDKKIKEIEKMLKEIKFESFECEGGYVGVFPLEGKGNTRIIWVKLISDKFKELNKLIEDKLIEIGIPKEANEFKSHVTAVRVYVVKNKKVLPTKLKQINFKGNSFEVKNFSLMSSELTPSGPIYGKIKDFKLGK